MAVQVMSKEFSASFSPVFNDSSFRKIRERWPFELITYIIILICVLWSSYSRHKIIVIKAFFSVTRKQDIYAESPHVQSKARFNINQSRKHTAVKTMTVVVNIQFCAIKAVCTLSENKSPTPLIFYNTEPTYKS